MNTELNQAAEPKTHRMARDLKTGEHFQFVDHDTVYIRVCNLMSGEYDVDYVDTESWYVGGCAGNLAVRNKCKR